MNEPQKAQSALAYVRETAQKFLDRETAGGILLIIATIVALFFG